MAQIHEEVIVVKLSKLVKDNTAAPQVASDDFVGSLQSVAEELAGAGVVVEVERA